MIARGQKINDRYLITKLIGEGGMANVYLAHDTILDRDVAVKILRGDLSDDEKFIRRFQREAISASSLSHPNIVEIYDVGEDHGEYFIVMEYVPGKTLKNLIKKRGNLTILEVLDIMSQLASGVAHAHESYIIHRDLKPQNVLILDDGLVKITDFGIAVAINSKELTQTNSVMGSVHYLPPEQANGTGSTIKSDIYSLGIIMYELLVGKLPFKGESAVEIAIKQMKDPIPSVRGKIPTIPQSIENIILKCCAKNPKNRYENVLELIHDLENCMNEEKMNEEKVAYKYPEDDLEHTKVMNKVEDVNLDETIVVKKKNLNPIIIGVSIVSLVFFSLAILLLVNHFSTAPDILVPDVSGKTIYEAENILKEAGFIIADNHIEEESNIEPGLVVKTNPPANVTRKKGIEVSLIISKKPDEVIVEDYKGKNYHEIKASLEAKGIYVLVEKKDVQSTDNIVADSVIEQKPEIGKKITKGDTVTLYIANIVENYPNFITENWSLTDIQAFAEKYSLKLEVEYEDTNEYKDGAIIRQSRKEGTKIISGVTLKITIARKIETGN